MLGADRVMLGYWRGKWKLPFEGLGSRDTFSQSWRIKWTRTCKITWKLCCCSHCIVNFESPHKQDNISTPKIITFRTHSAWTCGLLHFCVLLGPCLKIVIFPARVQFCYCGLPFALQWPRFCTVCLWSFLIWLGRRALGS